MPRTTVVSVAVVLAHLGDPDWALFDCRWAHKEPAAGRRDYLTGHIPGAGYVHPDELSGQIIPGKTGRHPLPDPKVMATRLSAWGIGPKTQVVAYDDTGGSIAARLWWILRWLGHDAVALLDGGWKAWLAGGHPVRNGEERRSQAKFIARVRDELVADAAQVDRTRTDPTWLVADARAAERYRGENEKIDPVAGHIAGAISLPWAENLDADGRFLPPDKLKARFLAAFGKRPASHVVCYCGSGVTAAHDAFAVFYAGLGEVKVYAGSWSEWIIDPGHAVATGEDRS